MILYQDCVVSPIEIKKGTAPKEAVKNFSALKPVEKELDARLQTVIGEGAVVCMAQDVIPIDRKNWYVPAWII